MPLYTAILFFSFIFPFALSFDKKVAFYKKWKSLFPSTIIVATFYIAFDVIFTKNGIWGFNPDYHSDIILLGLPIEEWLFFVFIPYASIFTHFVFIAYFPKVRLGDNPTKGLTGVFILLFLLIIAFNVEKAYTTFNYILLILTLIWAILDKSKILNSFYISFILILLPFLIINGILTGSFIEGEVVWYNNAENLGIRIGTIPLEDIGYAFSLILLNLLIMNLFEKLYSKKT